MRDYRKDECLKCIHIKICQIRNDLLVWLEKYHFPLHNNTSMGKDIDSGFKELLSKWCSFKENKNNG